MVYTPPPIKRKEMNIVNKRFNVRGIYEILDLTFFHKNSNTTIKIKNIVAIFTVGIIVFDNTYWLINSEASLSVVSANKTIQVGDIFRQKFCKRKWVITYNEITIKYIKTLLMIYIYFFLTKDMIAAPIYEKRKSIKRFPIIT